ncbi:MAG TPA: ABC transporter permease [Gemmatimonadales bacterium]|jgi:putative ABC transport system permease protein|nr:ABC transporter permease [Gemmatimonadales bacterium]HEV8598538.1 ABC transporter permease [Gemmatimonadales bacterium]
MLAGNLLEGMSVALENLRTNKLRSFLTILGVVIGVATVMLMASIVDGVRTQVFNALNAATPNAFYVMRFFSQTPLNPQNLPYEVRIRPVVSAEDADAIRREENIRHAGLWLQSFVRIEYGAVRSQGVWVLGADDAYMEIKGGTVAAGRFFTQGELNGAEVAVLELELSRRLFGQQSPLGETVQIGGRPFRVVGLWQQPDNVFQPPGFTIGAIVPYEVAKHSFRYSDTNDLFIVVLGRQGIPVTEAQDQATVALRKRRGLRPGMPNTFDFITQDQILDTMNSLTSMFFLVMTSISSVALLVGGIGVMAIMMVSVTDRTHEIGLRMACGASRREILWQFLVEAATLTLLGGMIGILIGLTSGQVLKRILNMQSAVPLWSAVLATLVSIAIGLGFGLLPANRAARMDPVEALRHE